MSDTGRYTAQQVLSIFTVMLFSALITAGGATLKIQHDGMARLQTSVEKSLDVVRDQIAHDRAMMVVVCGQLNELYRQTGVNAENECSDWATGTVGVPW